MTSKKRPCEADENDGDENSQPYKRRSGPRESLAENTESELEASKSSTEPCWRCRVLKKPVGHLEVDILTLLMFLIV
jgi:hypothetical protein